MKKMPLRNSLWSAYSNMFCFEVKPVMVAPICNLSIGLHSSKTP